MAGQWPAICFCRSGGSRELLLPPLRRQGRAGEGCLLDQREPWAPPPSLPLPSQGEGPRQAGRLQCAGEIPGVPCPVFSPAVRRARSEEHTSELQSLMRISYAVFCLKKKKLTKKYNITQTRLTKAQHTCIS